MLGPNGVFFMVLQGGRSEVGQAFWLPGKGAWDPSILSGGGVVGVGLGSKEIETSLLESETHAFCRYHSDTSPCGLRAEIYWARVRKYSHVSLYIARCPVRFLSWIRSLRFGEAGWHGWGMADGIHIRVCLGSGPLSPSCILAVFPICDSPGVSRAWVFVTPSDFFHPSPLTCSSTYLEHLL